MGINRTRFSQTILLIFNICKNTTIDTEDEICSNYNEDDLSVDDDY